MDCAAARRLIDAGVRPGSGAARRAELGFHVARCAACRDYLRAKDGLQQPADRAPQPPLLASGEGADGALGPTRPAAMGRGAGGAGDGADSRAPQPPLPAEEGGRGSPPPAAMGRGARGEGAKSLLADLLAAELAPARRPPPPRPLPRRRPGPLRIVLLALGALLIGGGVLFVGRLAYAAYQIRSNLAAMGVAPTPALQVPTWAADPTPSPVPSRAALAAPPAPQPSATAPAPGLAATAAIPADPPPNRPSASPAPLFVPSPTPVRLPAIDLGAAVLPTLMPTVNVAPPRGRAITVLLLGSDRRPGESWATRSDSIMLVRLEPATQRVALLSLPRDLVANIPGYGQARINAATVYGESEPGGGIDLARRTVSGLVGLPIDYVVRADFGAFTTAIDAIGGVEILVEEPLYDAAYPTMDYGYTEVSFDPGLQWMDGATALVYSRIRHGDSNYARNRRQQQVILAIIQRVRDQNILAQVQMLTDLTAELSDDIQTDLSPEQMLGLAWAMRNVDPAAVERYALDETMVAEGLLADDPYATFPLPGAIDLLVREFVGGPGV